ncbi:biotin--[acetyl-CoA-carboxylase] ligase [Facilibium subflavum]|uniref:biotin--[acetyl-CoA-carboxylase] ligase n=1 Tax=Facilibium subflavum TaxID=2219058 RepID=UPI000E65361E|nr:biotin--[acetyl-CoA-carboxylase] ligase [Facilibium subflavum]
MNDTLLGIVKLLNDHDYIDGNSIGAKLNITRAAVWKNIHQLQQQYGIAIRASKAKGYKLQQPLILLDQDKIKQKLIHEQVKLECFNSIDSTNRYLQDINDDTYLYHICLAEHQSKGKGRFSRSWSSPFGQNIYLSLKTNLTKDMSELSGLSLSIATVIANVIHKDFPILNPKIKWPNDIYLNDSKLSGVLIEVKAESNYQSQVIIGIGLNVNMTQQNEINQEWISLLKATGATVDRNQLATHLINALIDALIVFQNKGFTPFIDAYQSLDYLTGKTISLSLPNNTIITGICHGINQHGHIMLKKNDKIHTFASGEASCYQS